jgi:two-component system heavy metal sensor histidine kinase CusS
MRIPSLSLKLALLVGILGLLQAIAVLAFSYNTMSRSLDEQKRYSLRDKVVQARQLLDQEANIPAVSGAASRLTDLLASHDDLYIAVAKPGNVTPLIVSNSIAAESLHRLENDIWGKDAFLEWRSPNSNRLMLSIASASELRSGEEYVIVLTADRGKDEELLSGFLFTALTAAPFMLAIVSLGALFIVSIGLRPLNRFRKAAIAVSTQNISERIDPARLPSELLPLCLAFNGMLDRLDDGIRRLSQFSGDLAHEMRTPLATLLGCTQVALSQPRSHDQLLEVLEDNVEELERLARLVSDMLFLAYADNAEAVINPTVIDLASEAEKGIDYIELLAQERRISFRMTGHGDVVADPGLVRRAITNLLSNAVYYGASDSEVTVSVAADSQEVVLCITNHGKQIASEHHARLFDRFYRADSSRCRDVGGTGLGLAIVKAIMTLHGGSVEVESGPDGVTRFALRFPMKAFSKSSISR